MSADLSPLEQAAARVGLPGLKARVVPHDRRRGWWFRWERGELLVSDRVIDRCRPEDASALLIDDVLRSRRLERLMRWLVEVLVLVLIGVSWSAIRDGAPAWSRIALLCALAVWGIVTIYLRSRVALRADDETVRLLGDATPLVRGLNEMDFEELHVAGKVLPARPDLHRRAERLVRKFRLCESQPPA